MWSWSHDHSGSMAGSSSQGLYLSWNLSDFAFCCPWSIRFLHFKVLLTRWSPARRPPSSSSSSAAAARSAFWRRQRRPPGGAVPARWRRSPPFPRSRSLGTPGGQVVSGWGRGAVLFRLHSWQQKLPQGHGGHWPEAAGRSGWSRRSLCSRSLLDRDWLSTTPAGCGSCIGPEKKTIHLFIYSIIYSFFHVLLLQSFELLNLSATSWGVKPR